MQLRYPAPLRAPNVDSKQLFRHVKALNFKRYTVERDRARDHLTTLSKIGMVADAATFRGRCQYHCSATGLIRRLEQLVAAHYDTVPGSPGADDNASGVAVVLKLPVFSVHAPRHGRCN